MITSEEFVQEFEIDDKKNFKLGVVVELFPNDTAKVKFDGEETPSEKQYAYIATYIPKVSDRVLLAVTGGTYIILGKVNFNVPPDTNIEIDRYIFDLKKVSILKGLELTGAFNVNSGMTVVGNIGVNGSITSTGLSSTGVVSGSSVFTTGTLGAGDSNLKSLVVDETISSGSITSGGSVTASATIKGTTLQCTSFLKHSGSLSFFGKSSNYNKISISKIATSSPSIDELKIKLNALIGALNDYGLV